LESSAARWWGQELPSAHSLAVSQRSLLTETKKQQSVPPPASRNRQGRWLHTNAHCEERLADAQQMRSGSAVGDELELLVAQRTSDCAHLSQPPRCLLVGKFHLIPRNCSLFLR
jgi:hypothetical protein